MIWRDLNLTQSCQFVDVKKTDVFTVTLCLSNLFRSAFVMETSSEEVLSFQDKSSAKKIQKNLVTVPKKTCLRIELIVIPSYKSLKCLVRKLRTFYHDRVTIKCTDMERRDIRLVTSWIL